MGGHHSRQGAIASEKNWSYNGSQWNFQCESIMHEQRATSC